jgi:LacI family transcriptional regulator
MLDARNPFFSDVAQGVEDAARREGISVFLCNSASDPSREAEYLDVLMERRVRGVLLTPVGADPPGLARLRERGVPTVLVDRAGGGEYSSVGVDDVAGGALAVTHLRERGHRRIAFVGGPLTTVQVADRLEGARQVMASSGGRPEDLTLVTTDALDVAAGRWAGERIAAQPQSRRPTAAFCANDLVALGLLQQMTALGVDVPNGLAIVGYDDIDFAAAAAVPLSSVRQPRHELGRMAAELLLAQSAPAAQPPPLGQPTSPGSPARPRQVVYEPELVVRTSSASRISRARRSSGPAAARAPAS